jgi:hypothetical protein
MARDVASTRTSGKEARAELPGIEVAPSPNPSTRRNFLRPVVLVPHRLTPAERQRRICDVAYRLAEQRGFAPGNELDDWLEAEREVDAGRY